MFSMWWEQQKMTAIQYYMLTTKAKMWVFQSGWMPIVHDAVIMLVCCVVRKNDRHYCQGLLLTHHLLQEGKNEFYEFDHQRKLHAMVTLVKLAFLQNRISSWTIVSFLHQTNNKIIFYCRKCAFVCTSFAVGYLLNFLKSWFTLIHPAMHGRWRCQTCWV